jgi:hypothetical protein
MTDLAMLSLIESDVEHGRLIEIDEKMGVLPFYISAIPAFTTAVLSIHPYTAFRPRRLVYGGDRNLFVLEDLKIGKNTQMVVAPGPIPMECFPPHPVDGQSIDNLVGADLCHIAMLISMTVRNVTGRTLAFGAIIYGAIP